MGDYMAKQDDYFGVTFLISVTKFNLFYLNFIFYNTDGVFATYAMVGPRPLVVAACIALALSLNIFN